MKTVIAILILLVSNQIHASVNEQNVVYLSDLLGKYSLELCHVECSASASLLDEKILSQKESDKEHLSGQLQIWKKSCFRACDTIEKQK